MEENEIGDSLTEGGGGGKDGGEVEWVLGVEERRRAKEIIIRKK